MSTQSTKRAEKRVQNQTASKTKKGYVASSKGKSRRGVASVPEPEPVVLPPTAQERVSPLPMSDRAWKIWAVVILLVAAWARLFHLDWVPFHHDEGVNGNFLNILYKTGDYKYDPTNYHGPTLYYFALVSAYVNTFLFGKGALNDISMRLVPAFFGIGTVWLVLCLRRNIGAWASLFAAAFIALSPGMVYISRYFIHEMQFVFFTLGFVVGMLRYYETRDWRWTWLASASMAMVFGSKETAPISLIVILVAYGMTQALAKFSPQISDWTSAAPAGEHEERGWARVTTLPVILNGMVGVFALVTVIFYTSFGSNRQGIVDFFRAYAVWRETGSRDQGAPFLTYFWWLFRIETPLLFLSIVAGVAALIERRNRFAVFAFLWAFGLWLGYSKISYKTPWLMLNFVLPMAIVAGWGVQRLAEAAYSGRSRIINRFAIAAWKIPTETSSIGRAATWSLPIAGLALLVTSWQSWALNVDHYDDDSAVTLANGKLTLKAYPYVYVHTVRSYRDMLNKIEAYGVSTGQGKAIPIAVVSPEHWPTPWYLRDYTTVLAWGSMPTTLDNATLLIAREDQDAQVEQIGKEQFESAGQFELRPGVPLRLWVRKGTPAP